MVVCPEYESLRDVVDEPVAVASNDSDAVAVPALRVVLPPETLREADADGVNVDDDESSTPTVPVEVMTVIVAVGPGKVRVTDVVRVHGTMSLVTGPMTSVWLMNCATTLTPRPLT